MDLKIVLDHVMPVGSPPITRSEFLHRVTEAIAPGADRANHKVRAHMLATAAMDADGVLYGCLYGFGAVRTTSATGGGATGAPSDLIIRRDTEPVGPVNEVFGTAKPSVMSEFLIDENGDAHEFKVGSPQAAAERQRIAAARRNRRVAQLQADLQSVGAI